MSIPIFSLFFKKPWGNHTVFKKAEPVRANQRALLHTLHRNEKCPRRQPEAQNAG